ncbi:MAG: protein-L-isoaspartate(D-aspartate) O-methyltransferase [Thermodesulfobacteriota bacterium]
MHNGATEQTRQSEREAMVADQIVSRGIQDPRLLAALRAVPRHRFVPRQYQHVAYNDGPLPIGEGQTISQPYIVAYMTSLLEVHPSDRVLEVGTGSGYQAAILSQLAAEVYTIERVASFDAELRQVFHELGYDNVHCRIGDGTRGWPEAAPFQAILVTAAGPRVPAPLVEQLAVGGRLIMPVGQERGRQVIVRWTRTPSGELDEEHFLAVAFVPLRGAYV